MELICIESLIGKYVNLREVTLEDAAFILNLRCNERKSAFINPTKNDLKKQIDYLNNYFALENEIYFIIENKNFLPLGTIRLYNVKGKQYTGGSWIMSDSANVFEVIEGDFLFKNYAFNVLNFEKSIFDVRKNNKKVVNFHKSYGAKIIDENQKDYFFELTKETFKKNEIYFTKILNYER